MVAGKTPGEAEQIISRMLVEKYMQRASVDVQVLEARDTVRAESLVRDHALGLAEHVAKYANYLD